MLLLTGEWKNTFMHMHMYTRRHDISTPIRRAGSLVTDRKIMQQPMSADRGDTWQPV